MRAQVMVVMTVAALFTLTARADWQWVEVGTVENDISQDETQATWAADDCELISDAAGAYLYHSGEIIKKSKDTDEKEQKAALFKAVIALSQLSVNHADVYQVFCKP